MPTQTTWPPELSDVAPLDVINLLISGGWCHLLALNLGMFLHYCWGLCAWRNAPLLWLATPTLILAAQRKKADLDMPNQPF